MCLTASYKNRVMKFFALVPNANLFFFEYFDWSKAIAACLVLLVKTLNLAVDHPEKRVFFKGSD